MIAPLSNIGTGNSPWRRPVGLVPAASGTARSITAGRRHPFIGTAAMTRVDFPLHRDPNTIRDNAVRSFTRAALCVGLAGLNKSRPGDLARQSFADDRGVDLILRAAVSPTALTNSPALSTISVAILDALVPASAGAVVGRIFKVHAAPMGTSWMWTLAFEQHEDRTPTHGYEPTREAAMAAFAKSWRTE